MSVSIKHDQPAIICDVQYTGGNSRYLIFRVDFVATLINRNGFTDHQTFFLICRQEGCAVKIFDISQSLCDGFCGQGGFGISPFRSSGGSEQLCRKIFYRRIDTDPKDEVFDLSCFKVRDAFRQDAADFFSIMIKVINPLNIPARRPSRWRLRQLRRQLM